MLSVSLWACSGVNKSHFGIYPQVLGLDDVIQSEQTKVVATLAFEITTVLLSPMVVTFLLDGTIDRQFLTIDHRVLIPTVSS